MSQQPPDDEFERRLRDVFRDRNLGVPVSPDALGRIHAGARRRQQHRTLASVTAAFVVVAIAGIGVGIRSADRGGNAQQVAAGLQTPAPSPVKAASSGVVSPSVASSLAPVTSPLPSALRSPPSSTAPSAPSATPAPTAYPSVGSAVPASFSPLSVTAVSTKTFWVLGTQQCGQQTCTAIVQTTDGGSHFAEVAAPHAATISIDNATRVIDNVRFADTDNGWAYGEALWTTSDGGASWTDTSLPAGAVLDLGAAHAPGAVAGTVWAVVQPSPFISGYELWSAPYAPGSGTGTWEQVDLGSDPPSDDRPSLVVQGATAYLLAADSKKATHVYVASSGVATTMFAAPCSPVGSNLSAGVGSLWAACSVSSAGSPAVRVSTDGGATWRAVVSPSGYALGVIGGVDATTAVIDEGTGLAKVSASGQPRAVSIASTTNGFSFIGFTDAKTGFALSQPDTVRLWRTTDGGLHWTAIGF